MKRWILAVAAIVMLAGCQLEMTDPVVTEAIAVVDTRGHVLTVVLIRSDGSTVKYDANTGRDVNEAIRIGNELSEEDRYVVVVLCPDDVKPGVAI